MKILVIDDALDSRVLVTGLVRKVFAQAQIIPAASAIEAIDLARRTKPDVVISDLYIKDGSGFDLLQAFPRGRRGFAIMIISFEDRPEVLQRLEEAGADEFIAKPLDPPLFWQKLGKLALNRSILGESPVSGTGAQFNPKLVRPERDAPAASLALSAALVELSENHVVFRSAAELLVGARVELAVASRPGDELVIPVRVAASELDSGGGFVCRALVQERLSFETGVELRRLIFAAAAAGGGGD